MALNTVVFAFGMLLAGSFNTIATKYQDSTVTGQDAEGKPILFLHPAVQTGLMFCGEALCLLPYFFLKMWRRRGVEDMATEEQKADASTRFRSTVLAFALPALCDATATTLLNIGLFYTYASVFQMLRGTLVVFAGILTIVILKRRLHSHHWLGMALIGAGAALVGASSILFKKSCPPEECTAPNPLLGDTLVIGAQLLNAAQFIIEEKYLAKFRASPLLAVGSEGIWGILLSLAALPVIGQIQGPSGQPLDSAAEAFRQIAASPRLQWTTACTVLSVAAFNFCGISVTKRLSGAARAAIDACRTVLIWMVCLYLGWEQFIPMQVIGFAVLISGTSVYNDILRSCLPMPEPDEGHHHRHHHHGHNGEAHEIEDLEQPLLLQGRGSGGNANTSTNAVRFAEPPTQRTATQEARPLRAPRSRVDYSMARSVTLLPAALSPRSMSSMPSGLTWQGLASSGSTTSGELGRSPGSSSGSESEDEEQRQLENTNGSK